MGGSGDGASVQAVDRTLQLLTLLGAAAPDAVRVSDAAAHLEVSSATASRMLATLTARGYASRAPGRRFTVGPRSMELATRWVGQVRRDVGPSVGRLATATGEAVVVAQLLGEEVAAITITAPPRHPVHRAATAARPTWSTATGQALLATLPQAHVERVLADAPPGPWRERLRGDAGLFAEHGETAADLSCFAVALAGRRGHVVALAVLADRDRPGPIRHDRIRHRLRDEAAVLGAGRLT